MKITEAKLNQAINVLKRDITEKLSVIIENSVGILVESVDDTQDYDEAISRLAAAKRAMGIINRMPKGPYKKQHASRVFTNLNHIRNNITKLIQKCVQSMEPEGEVSTDTQQVA
jgi:hypothetical protein